MNSSRKKYTIILAIFLLLVNLSFTGQPDEYVIKAVLIEKISSFVEWPEEKTPDNNTFTIGIINNHRFGNILEKTYENRKILGKKLIVKFLRIIMKYKAVIFDLNGTTVLEKDPQLVLNCFEYA
ncbi:MAG: YfiR family protein, partial [Melioribacteraceae bacterium]